MAKTQKRKLLTAAQRTVCMQVTLKEAPFSQRAHALLEVDKGSTQAEAAELSGLSLGQVKYWVARFRELGLEMFPATLREAPVVETEEKDVTVKAEKPSKGKEKKKKSSKSKKLKKDKKKKSGKKDKKKGSKKKSSKKSKGKKKK